MEIGIIVVVVTLIYLSLQVRQGAVGQAIAINGGIFVLFLLPPLIAEWWTATSSNVPGTGFSILLYEPFDFAYVSLVTLSFIAANLHLSRLGSSKVGIALAGSVAWAVLWFIVSFFAVGQLHVSLGGLL